MALAHITLATRDVRRSPAFFAEALGWRPIARPNNIGRPAAWLSIAPGVELHLIEDPEFEPSRFETRVRPAHRRHGPARPSSRRSRSGSRPAARRSSTPCATRRSSGSSSATRTDTSSRSSKKATANPGR